MNKSKILIYFSIAVFGILGIYLTFFAGDTNQFDSQTKAYRIDANESYDSDGGSIYYPSYYFRANGKEYECKAKMGSSSYPSEKKNTVYYDSSDPTKCKTEYETSTGKFGGIICLIATVVIIYFFIIKKPSTIDEGYHRNEEIDLERQYQMESENAEKIIGMVGKVQLIYKRIILGIIIAILLVFILIDISIVKQTIVSKDYPEITAKFVNRIKDDESNAFDDCIYTFTDNQGRQQEIIVSVSKNSSPEEEIKIKYNEKNPQDYYEEGSTMDKSGIIWFIVKVIAFILLIILFFNKKLLSKINISASSNVL